MEFCFSFFCRDFVVYYFFLELFVFRRFFKRVFSNGFLGFFFGFAKIYAVHYIKSYLLQAPPKGDSVFEGFSIENNKCKQHPLRGAAISFTVV